MSAPTLVVRTAVYRRDDHRCVACHSGDGLTFQHRRAVGMGGSKIRPGTVDGLTLCITCNQAVEGDMQTLALASGWKVRKWVSPELIPVRYPHEFCWFRLEGIKRHRISGVVAVDMLHAAYGDQILKWEV